VDSASGIAQPTVLTPAQDQLRGVDAELRAALYELVSDRPLAALTRLDWLKTAPGITDAATERVRDTTQTGAARAREDLAFLRAESFYRLGMSQDFRTTATDLLSGQGTSRYAGVVGTQLMLDSYRRGDNAKVLQLSRTTAVNGDRALASLIAGLAAYQMGDYPTARQWLATPKQGGDDAYAQYARYVDALASMQGDTTKAAEALADLQGLATTATGDFGDQVRLTAAQLSYQAGKYQQASDLAGRIDSTSGVAAQALLTRSWALYKGQQLDSAAVGFSAFARRYPQLPERDEARLMAAQLQLEAKHTDQAAATFHSIADSLNGEVGPLQTRVSAPMTDAARTLVAANAAGLLFVSDPGAGKSVVLPDAAGANHWLVLSAFAGNNPTPARSDSGAAHVETLADVQTRLQPAVTALGPQFPARVLFARSAGPPAVASYADKAQALRTAEIQVRSTNYQLAQATADQQARMAAMGALQTLLVAANQRMVTYDSTLRTTRDSLAKMVTVMDTSRARVRRVILSQVEATRRASRDTRANADSVRAALQGHLTPADLDLLKQEVQTADAFTAAADDVERGLDGLLRRNPIFAIRDKLGVNLTAGEALSTQTKSVLGSDDALVTAELARLRSGESDRMRSARSAVAAAEQRRAAAEGGMIALVDAELKGRATTLLATMKRDQEGADFGTASAAFFKAVDATPSAADGAAAARPPAGDTSLASPTPPER